MGCFVLVCLTDGICSLLLVTPHLLQTARLKIQKHMRCSRGVSHGVIAKSQTGCKCRSAFFRPFLYNAVALLKPGLSVFRDLKTLE